MAVKDCLSHKWLEKEEKVEQSSSRKLRQSLRNLKQFIARRKWQVGSDEDDDEYDEG